MNLEKVFQEDRRLCILRLLHEQPDYSMNHSVMQKGLYAIGHSVSKDLVLTEFSWLAEQGLISLRKLENDLRIAKINDRGVDVAMGRVTNIEGIARPSPGGS